MDGISGNIQGAAVCGNIYLKSQGCVNWSGFFGDDDNDYDALDNVFGYKEISEHGGYRGIYKGDCIKERKALTSTQIFCADTNEVCVICPFLSCLKMAKPGAGFRKKNINRILHLVHYRLKLDVSPLYDLCE